MDDLGYPYFRTPPYMPLFIPIHGLMIPNFDGHQSILGYSSPIHGHPHIKIPTGVGIDVPFWGLVSHHQSPNIYWKLYPQVSWVM